MGQEGREKKGDGKAANLRIHIKVIRKPFTS